MSGRRYAPKSGSELEPEPGSELECGVACIALEMLLTWIFNSFLMFYFIVDVLFVVFVYAMVNIRIS